MAKRYQRCDQKPSIKERRTIQWPKERGQNTAQTTKDGATHNIICMQAKILLILLLISQMKIAGKKTLLKTIY